MSLFNIIILIAAHFFADFFCQSRKLADTKSEDLGNLTIHVGIYSLVMSLIVRLLTKEDWDTILVINALFFVTHWLTDYVTSRITKQYYKKQNYYAFFNTIAVDQFIHLSSVFGICYLLLS